MKVQSIALNLGRDTDAVISSISRGVAKQHSWDIIPFSNFDQLISQLILNNLNCLRIITTRSAFNNQDTARLQKDLLAVNKYRLEHSTCQFWFLDLVSDEDIGTMIQNSFTSPVGIHYVRVKSITKAMVEFAVLGNEAAIIEADSKLDISKVMGHFREAEGKEVQSISLSRRERREEASAPVQTAPVRNNAVDPAVTRRLEQSEQERQQLMMALNSFKQQAEQEKQQAFMQAEQEKQRVLQQAEQEKQQAFMQAEQIRQQAILQAQQVQQAQQQILQQAELERQNALEKETLLQQERQAREARELEFSSIFAQENQKREELQNMLSQENQAKEELLRKNEELTRLYNEKPKEVIVERPVEKIVEKIVEVPTGHPHFYSSNVVVVTGVGGGGKSTLVRLLAFSAKTPTIIVNPSFNNTSLELMCSEMWQAGGHRLGVAVASRNPDNVLNLVCPLGNNVYLLGTAPNLTESEIENLENLRKEFNLMKVIEGLAATRQFKNIIVEYSGYSISEYSELVGLASTILWVSRTDSSSIWQTLQFLKTNTFNKALLSKTFITLNDVADKKLSNLDKFNGMEISEVMRSKLTIMLPLMQKYEQIFAKAKPNLNCSKTIGKLNGVLK